MANERRNKGEALTPEALELEVRQLLEKIDRFESAQHSARMAETPTPTLPGLDSSPSGAGPEKGSTAAAKLGASQGSQQNMTAVPGAVEGRFEIRPIGTPQGFQELATLHQKTWKLMGVEEKRVYTMMWPLSLHFGLYWVTGPRDESSLVQQVTPTKTTRPKGRSVKRPQLVGAFWARSLAEAPLTLGHLYPPALFHGLRAEEVFEFGGMVVDPEMQRRGLARALSDGARLFIFSRRPELIITNPIEPLAELYRSFGMKTVGDRPVDYPYANNVKVFLMYGRFRELAGPYFM